MKNKVGIVILNYNTPKDVINCIDSIYEKTECSYKIYIVDNNSTDDSYKIFTERYSNFGEVEILVSNSNRGFSAGNNIGIKKAIYDGCKYICLVNADILLDNDAISILLDKLESNSDVGIVAPSVLTPNTLEETQFARRKLTFKNYLGEKTLLKKNKRYVKRYPRIIKENIFETDFKFFGMTYGCFYLLKSETLIQIDMLDEDVFLFNEEDILAYKIESMGLKTLISPDARVIHNHHSSISKTSIAFRVFHFRVSALIVLRKYAKVNLFKLSGLILIFKISWFFHSLFNSNYRRLYKEYFTKLNSIYKMKV